VEAQLRLAEELKELSGQHEVAVQAERQQAEAALQAAQRSAAAAHALELEKERSAAATALKNALEELHSEHAEKTSAAQDAHNARARELQV
jgi:hypothetical protein